MAAETQRVWKVRKQDWVIIFTALIAAYSGFMDRRAVKKAEIASNQADKTSIGFDQTTGKLSITLERAIREIIQEEFRNYSESEKEWKRNVREDIRTLQSAYIVGKGRR